MAKKTEAEVAEVEPLPEPVPESPSLSGPTKVTKDMILKDMWNKEARDQLLADDTLEPHKHLVLVLIMVLILAVILSAIQF